MQLLRKFLIKIFIIILLTATALSSRANSVNFFSDYLSIGSTVVSAATDLTATLGGIKNNLEHDGLKQIFAGITTLKVGKIGEILKIFLSNATSWNWVIMEGSLQDNANGQTQLASDTAITTLDYSKLKNATNLSVARTMIHEMVHAYLLLYFKNDNINATKDHPEIVTAWEASKKPDLNKIHHTEIEKNYVEDIAESLNEFGQKVGLVSVDTSVYQDLAWGGLDFESNHLLTDVDKQRIQYRLSAEQSNTTIDTETPVGDKLISDIDYSGK